MSVSWRYLLLPLIDWTVVQGYTWRVDIVLAYGVLSKCLLSTQLGGNVLMKDI